MLDPEDRAALVGVGRPRRYNRGATIVIQGDHSDTVFVVVAGRVKISQVTSDGREIVLAVDEDAADGRVVEPRKAGGRRWPG